MKLKLFPLGLVAYPSKYIPLHIFEERYKNLINECINKESEFGIVYQDSNGLAKIGCTVVVKEILNRYSDGRMDIVSEGKKIFRLDNQSIKNKLTIGEVSYLPNIKPLSRGKFEPLKEKYLQLLIMLGLKEDISRHLEKTKTFELLEMMQLSPEFELELISLNSELQRVEILHTFFDSLLKQSSLFNSDERFST